MLRIRLQRKGRKKRPIWHIVVAERHEARDGRIVERVGRYDNVTEKKEVVLNEDRILYWLDTGAQPTDTVRKILRREGILYKRHLVNWGKSEEEVEKALTEWREYRDSKKEDSVSRKEDYKAVLAAEEKEYKEQLQKKAKQAAAEVEAEKAAAEAEKEDDAPKSDADKIEEALENADTETTEESVEETAAAEEAAVEETQEESAEKPVAEAEAAEEVVEEDEVAEPEEPTAKEAAEAVEEKVAEADEEPEVEDAKEETKDEAPAEEEKAEESSDQVSTDMTAKEAIDHINNTDLADLKGFVPDDEDRVTVQRAWDSKQEG